jgi:hypothetical protein
MRFAIRISVPLPIMVMLCALAIMVISGQI